tara:strand:- start:298 stop:483 length:186 start_codon:yes stop_codon:yes gene_type:complete
MSKVKQWAEDTAEKEVDNILKDVKNTIVSIDSAREKILSVNNVNMLGIDDNTVDEVIAEAI